MNEQIVTSYVRNIPHQKTAPSTEKFRFSSPYLILEEKYCFGLKKANQKIIEFFPYIWLIQFSLNKSLILIRSYF